MKKRLLAALLCLCLMLTTLPYAAMAEEETPLTTGTVYGINDGSKLYVRAEPSTASQILRRLYKHQQLIVLGPAEEEGWVHVKTDVIEGYVMASFITPVGSVTLHPETTPVPTPGFTKAPGE